LEEAFVEDDYKCTYVHIYTYTEEGDGNSAGTQAQRLSLWWRELAEHFPTLDLEGEGFLLVV